MLQCGHILVYSFSNCEQKFGKKRTKDFEMDVKLLFRERSVFPCLITLHFFPERVRSWFDMLVNLHIGKLLVPEYFYRKTSHHQVFFFEVSSPLELKGEPVWSLCPRRLSNPNP